MSHRPFLIFPDPRLRHRAAPVEGVDEETRALWDEMLAAMYAMPGVGLAAPQLGVGLRLAVLDCSERGDQPVRLANPEIIEVSTETRRHREASPNAPGFDADVSRPAMVELRFLNAGGEVEERRFEGLWATSAQHQIDHLNGKLFFDRLGPVKRRMIIDRLSKAKRARARA